MKKIRLAFLVLMMAVAILPMSVQAKTVTKYATKTIALKDKANGKTVVKVKAKTKLTVTKTGKVWVKVTYQDQTLYTKRAFLHSKKPTNKYKGKSFKRVGRARWGGYSWTWYTTRRYPDRKNALGINGKHTDKNGFVLDKDGYICLASGRGNKKKHAIVPTPFGRYGKVYDTNGGYNNKWFDVYVNW